MRGGSQINVSDTTWYRTMLSALGFGKGHDCRLSSKGQEAEGTSERQDVLWMFLDGDSSCNQNLTEYGCQAAIAVPGPDRELKS